MNPREKGFLLLSSNLGDPLRKPLTTAQLRTLADRAWQMDVQDGERNLVPEDLMTLGYGAEMAGRIVALLEQEDLLEYYIKKAAARHPTATSTFRRKKTIFGPRIIKTHPPFGAEYAPEGGCIHFAFTDRLSFSSAQTVSRIQIR